MITDSVSDPNLNGKWILKDIDAGNGRKGYPGFQLLEIKDLTAELYTDFSLKKQSLSFKVVDKQILTKVNGKFASYELINCNHLKLFVNGKSNGKAAVFECDFFRLEPTKTELKKEEIEKMIFTLIENGRETKLEFNKELWNKERLGLHKRKEGEKQMIEQIDSTYFLSMFHNGKRNGSIPIKEVNTDLLKLHAVPTGPMEITAYRKK
jgi:hypothetical protein